MRNISRILFFALVAIVLGGNAAAQVTIRVKPMAYGGKWCVRLSGMWSCHENSAGTIIPVPVPTETRIVIQLANKLVSYSVPLVIHIVAALCMAVLHCTFDRIL